MRGAQMTFSGTTISVPIDAIVATITLNGGTFNNYCYFETTNSVPGSGTGGCTFNDSTYFFHNYSGSGIWRFNTSTGNHFNGQVRLKNISTGEMTFGGAGVNVFNGNVVIENSNNGGIFFGNDTLRSGYTLSIGSGGYSDGEFRATSFYQAGSTSQSLTFTGTALPTLDGAQFNGSFSLTANLLLFKNCTFYSTATITDAGSSSSSWYGGNNFYGNVTVTNNASAGNLRLDASSPNTYYANATFNGSRDLRVCYGGGESPFYGDITAGSNTTFHQGSGTILFYGSNNQTVSITNVLYKTKIQKSGGYVTLNGAHSSTGLFTFNKGNLITTSTNLLTITSTGTVSGASDSSFIEGPVKKIGNSSFVFPIGKGSEFRAVEITAPSNVTDAFTGEYFNSQQTLGSSMDSTLNYLSAFNYWKVDRTTGASNVALKFYYSQTNTDIVDTSQIKICRWNSTKWNNLGSAIVDASKFSSGTLSSFGYFLAGYNIPTGKYCEKRNISTIGDDCNYHSILFQNDVQWLTFQPGYTSNKLVINDPVDSVHTNAYIKKLIFYTGSTCKNLTVAKTIDFPIGDLQDNLFMLQHNFDSTQTYVLRVEKYSKADSCTVCLEDSLYLNYCFQSLKSNDVSSWENNCPNNLFVNGDFQQSDVTCINGPPLTGTSGNRSHHPFLNPSCVPGWQNAWGTPNINDNSLIASPGQNFYAHMWSSGASAVGQSSEGIFQTFSSNLDPSKTYVLKYKARMAPSTVSNITDLYFSLSNSSTSNLPRPWVAADIFNIGGPLYTLTNALPIPNEYVIHKESNFSSATWVSSSFYFQPQNNQNQFTFYTRQPIATGASVFAEADDFCISELITDPPSISVCGNPNYTIGPETIDPTATYIWDNSVPGLSCYNCPNPEVINTSGVPQTHTYTCSISYPCSTATCTTSYQITITLLPGITMSMSPASATLCGGQSVTFNSGIVNYGGSYTFNVFNTWPGNGGPISTVIGNSFTINTDDVYTAIATNSYGCSVSVDVPVTLINSTFDFTINNCGSMCSGSSITVHASGNNLWNWDFGDGYTTSQSGGSGTNVTHTYTAPGVYPITLVRNSGTTCSDIRTKWITVFPEPTGATSGCCVCEAYDEANLEFWDIYSYLVSPSSGNTETWNGSIPWVTPWNTDYRIKEKIIVPAGKTLEIKNLTLYFGFNGKIIVERGGTLILDNAILEGLTLAHAEGNCLTAMWQGIEVWGDPNKSQTATNSYSSGSLFQGKVKIYGSSEIRNAHNAVVLGKPKYGGFEIGFGGGIIEAYGSSSFYNNGVHIRFGPYKSPVKFAKNVSYISNCNFLSYYLRDRGYHTGNSYTYPNSKFPFYAHFNSTSRTANAIQAEGINDPLVSSNLFQGCEQAIYTLDSKMRIVNNTFNGAFSPIKYGIFCSYGQTSFYFGNNITGNTFKDCKYGTYLLSSAGDIIQNNDFNNSFNGSASNNNFGLILMASRNFLVMDNSFKNYSNWGIAALGTGNIGGYIGYQSTGNSFSECQTNIFSYKNPALTVRCNFFDNTTAYSEKSWDVRDVLATQGSSVPGSGGSQYVQYPAGNLFNNTSMSRIMSDVGFDYIRHDNSTGVSSVDFDDTDLPTPPTTNLTHEVIANVSMTSFTAACDPVIVPCCDHNRIAAIDSLIDSLGIINTYLNERLALQDFSNLSYEIDNNRDSSELKDILIAASPLSDTALSYLCTHSGVLSKTAVGYIYILNSPMKEPLVEYIAANYTTMDSAVFSSVLNAQGLPSTNTIIGVEKQTSSAVTKRQALYNEFVTFYNDSISPDTAATFLNSKLNLEYLQQLFCYYMILADTDSINSAGSLFENYIEEIDMDWVTVEGIIYSQFNEGLTLFDLNEDQHASLQEVAEKSEASLATANARAILKYVYNEEYYDDFGEGSFRLLQNGVTENMKADSLVSINDKWIIVPNPTTGNFALINLGRNAFNNVNVSIINADSRIVFSNDINTETNKALFKLNLSNGIYFVKINEDNKKQRILKLVITR